MDGEYGGGGVADGDRVTSRRRGRRAGLESEGRQGVIPALDLLTLLGDGLCSVQLSEDEGNFPSSRYSSSGQK